MKLLVNLAMIGLACFVAGASASIGPDDFAAVDAVAEAAKVSAVSTSIATKKIAIAKKREAFAESKAHQDVSRAIEKATRYSARAVARPTPIAIAKATHSAERVAEAIAEAKEDKMQAKLHTMKVVAKSMAKAAEINMKYGGKAALAVGGAALNDAATFAPLLAGIAPDVLPQLAQGLTAGPAGIQSALGGLAQAIGGALTGSSGIGLAGPDLLANRVAGLLPNNLLDNVPNLDIDLPTGGDDNGMQGLIANMPPQVLDAIVGFLSGGDNSDNSPLDAVLAGSSNGIINIPGNAIRDIIQGITDLMRRGGTPLNLDLDLPNMPSGGLPFPLQQLGNLMGVLRQPQLTNVLRSLPRSPLAGLLNNLPLGLGI